MIKMFIKTFILFCLTSFFSFHYVFGQDDIGVDLHTGIPAFSIPVWTIQEGGVSHNISLTYTGRAVKLKDKYGSLGIGWQLNAGGSVTRVLRGLPDDFVGGTGDERRGWLNSTAAQNLQSFTSQSDNNLENCNDTYEGLDYNVISSYGLHDTEPDIFNFNVGGISGSFVFDASGNIKTIPYIDVKIEDTNPATDKLEGFILTTNDGIKYYFEEGNNASKKVKDEGDFAFNEKKKIFKRDFELYEKSANYNDEWSLTKIMTPEGHTINFSYSNDYFTSDIKEGLSYTRTHTNKSLNKIYSENFEIDFSVKTLNILYADLYGFENLVFYPESGYIKVYNGTGSVRDLIKEVNIEYFYTLNNEEKDRRFIKSITQKCNECNEKPYSFDYWGLSYINPTLFTPSSSDNSDYWGYIKNGLVDEGIPRMYIYPDETGVNRYRIKPLPPEHGEPVILGARTADSDSDATRGSLRKITYPAGGTTSFTYELNAYYDPYLEDSVQGGGIRIKSITSNDGVRVENNDQKNYYYRDENNQSSGRLLNHPIFAAPRAKEFAKGYEELELELSSGLITLQEFWEELTYLSNHDLNRPANSENVVYNTVRIVSKGEGSVVYDFDSSPDFFEANSSNWSGTVSKVAREKITSGSLSGRCLHPGTLQNGYNYFPYAPSPNYDYLQALPSKTRVFDEAGNIRKSLEYDFDQVSLHSGNPYTIKAMRFNKVAGRYFRVSGDGTHPPEGEMVVFGKYTINTDIKSVLTQIIEKNYDSNNSGNYITQEKKFYYDSPFHLELTSEKIINSDGLIYGTSYKYPKDYIEANPFFGDHMVQMIQYLKGRFMHGVVIEKLDKLQKPGEQELVTGGELTLFDSFNGVLKPSEIYNLRIEEGLSSFVTSRIVKERLSDNYIFTYSNNYRHEQKIEDYDTKGNIITSTGLQRISNAAHMGYNFTLPILNIKNAKASEVAFSDFTNTATGYAFSGTGTLISSGRTGDSGYQLNSSQYIQQDNVQKKQGADNYIFSCWIRSSIKGEVTVELRNSSNVLQTSRTFSYQTLPGQWKYYEVKLPVNNIGDQIKVKAQARNSVIVDDTYKGISIDDVAFYPADADISYFSYKHLVGKTSETNREGKTTFYIYNSDHKLKLTKDEDGNILKRFKSEFTSIDETGYGLYEKAETVLVEGVTTEAEVDALTHVDKATNYNYYDGFGRPLQQVSHKASPSGNDIVQFYEHLLPGAPNKSYLPYAVAQTTGAFRSAALTEQLTFYNTSGNDVATDIHPYSVTVTDQSPLQNVLKQGGPGADWQPGAGHEVQYIHRANTLVDAVRIWETDGTSTAIYPAGSLFVQEMIDENGNPVATFSDILGRTILKRVTADAASDPYLDTYYVYDDLSRQKFSISPEAVSSMKSSGSWSVMDNAVLEFCFRNAYDDFGRLSEVKVPGKAVTYYVYDNTDRLLLAQDGNLRQSNKWLYQKYDSRGNIVLEGIYTDDTRTTLVAMQDYVKGIDYDGGNVYHEIPNNSTQGYSNSTFPQSGTEVLRISYYDDYDFDRNGSADVQAGFLYDGLYPWNKSVAHPRLRITGEKKKIIGLQDQWLLSYHRYDEYGRIIQSRGNNHLNTSVADINTLLYDFSGKLLKNKVTTAVNGLSTIVLQEYDYDHAGRLLKIHHKVDANDPVLLLHNKYNELGQLTDKKLHATNTAETEFMQSVDYRYNIRGWLTSINNATVSNNSANNDDSDDYFGMELGYNTALGTGNNPQFNGNISAIKWSAHLGLDEEKERAYNYTYDKADRIKTGDYKNKTTSWNTVGGAFSVSNIQYDKNGNVKTLTRKGADGSNLDALIYNYGSGTAKSNRLLGVTDTGNLSEGFKEGNTSGDDYGYDPNGNTIKDLNKGISAISYNVLNRPASISKADGSIKYIYDATGVKLSQEVYNASNELIKRTDYIGGIVYENQEVQFIQHPEGRVMMADHEGLGIFPEYQYHLRDHLGNVRVTFTSKPKTSEYLATGEDDRAGDESVIFSNYEDAVILQNPIANHTPGVGHNKAVRLNATNRQIVGLAKSLKVYPGDKIQMEVYAKFLKELSGAKQTNVGVLMGPAFLNAFGIVNSGETQELFEYFSDFFAAGPVFTSPYDDGVPNAYLNYLLFDKDYNLMDAGFQPLSNAAKEDGSDVPHELLSLEADVTKEGYIYIYLSNENDMVNEVFFDDLKINHIESPVVQVTDYYPFGLQHANSWTRSNSVKNNRLFNSGSELNEITDNYETYYRNYDPALGRFMAVDPMAGSFTSWTPYNYGFNDPIYYNDPKGDCADCSDFVNAWLDGGIELAALYDDPRAGGPVGGGGYGGYGGYGEGPLFVNGVRTSIGNFSALQNFMYNSAFTTGNFAGINFGTTSAPTRNGNGQWGYWVDPKGKVTGNLGDGTLTVSARRSYWVPIGEAQNGGDSFLWSNRALTVGGALYTGLGQLMANQRGWLDSRGNFQKIELLQRGSNGKYVQGVQGYRNGLNSAIQAGTKFRIAGSATVGVSVIIGGVATYNGYKQDGNQFGYNAQHAAGSTVGGVVGAWAGAKSGAIVGGAIGAWFGGVGAVPGVAIGAFVGGVVGGFSGSYLGENTVNYYHGI